MRWCGSDELGEPLGQLGHLLVGERDVGDGLAVTVPLLGDVDSVLADAPGTVVDVIREQQTVVRSVAELDLEVLEFDAQLPPRVFEDVADELRRCLDFSKGEDAVEVPLEQLGVDERAIAHHWLAVIMDPEAHGFTAGDDRVVTGHRGATERPVARLEAELDERRTELPPRNNSGVASPVGALLRHPPAPQDFERDHLALHRTDLVRRHAIDEGARNVASLEEPEDVGHGFRGPHFLPLQQVMLAAVERRQVRLELQVDSIFVVRHFEENFRLPFGQFHSVFHQVVLLQSVFNRFLHGPGLSPAPVDQAFTQFRVGKRQYLNRKHARVLGVADSHRCHWNTRRHLDNRQQAVHTIERIALDGHANNRQVRQSGRHAGQMRSATGASDDHLDAILVGVPGEGEGAIRRTMRGHHARGVGDAEFLESFGRLLHGGPVRPAPHDDRDTRSFIVVHVAPSRAVSELFQMR